MKEATSTLLVLCVAVGVESSPLRISSINIDQIDDMKLTKKTRDYLNYQFQTDKYRASIKPGVLRDASTPRIPKWTKYPVGDGRWKIPYEIKGTIDATKQLFIKAAFADFEKFGCFQFVPRTSEVNYLQFVNDGASGCWSYVGRRDGKPNTIQFGDNCDSKGVALHEIMHAFGFFHEQQRPDRDKYITVHWDNIVEGMEMNFEKKTRADVDSLGSPYDILSIMHYHDTSFSKNGLKTLTTKDGKGLDTQREYLTNSDIEQLRIMYKCKGNKMTTTTVAKKETVTTTKPTITKKPETDKNCVDYNEDCYYLEEYFDFCHDQDYREQAAEECAFTCGLCEKKVGVTVAPNKPEMEKGCFDNSINCDDFVLDGLCYEDPKRAEKECAFTCGICGCQDKKNDCAELAYDGYCQMSEYMSSMKTNCPKSCGYCHNIEIINEFEEYTTAPYGWF